MGWRCRCAAPRRSGETRLIRLWAISAVTPIESAVVHTQKWVQNGWTNYAYLRGVRRENRELRAQIERMKIEDARLSEDARMARRVQTLLGFKEQYVESTVAAQVIGTSGSEQSRVLYIDKGSKDGIKTDMAVITPTGIVGKIVQVFPTSAQVLPINDQFSGVGAVLKDTRLQGILKGAQNGTTTLQYIMSDEKVEPGEEVLTSGGDRIFPKGLPVGKVVSVEPGKDLFLNIRVIPSSRLDQLEEVLVVTKITEKMPDAKDLAPIRASDILAERLPTVPTKPGNRCCRKSEACGRDRRCCSCGRNCSRCERRSSFGDGTAAANKPVAGRHDDARSQAQRRCRLRRRCNGDATTGGTGTAKPANSDWREAVERRGDTARRARPSRRATTPATAAGDERRSFGRDRTPRHRRTAMLRRPRPRKSNPLPSRHQPES